MENYQKLKNKLKTSKSNLTKSINNCGDEFINFEKSRNGGPKKRQERCADYALETLKEVRMKMRIMKAASEAVINEIDDLGANLSGEKGEKPDDIKKTITSETETYEAKYKEFESKYDDLIQQAEAILSGQDQTIEQVQVTNSGKTGWRAFKPQAALKPPFLEKESSHLEVSHI